MKFIFNAYPSNSQGGGAVIKINKIRSFLQGRGHQADLYDQWATKIDDYDIYHHFSMFPGDLPMLRFAHATGVKIAVETMYWESWQHIMSAPSRSMSNFALRLGRYALRRVVPPATRERAILDIADCVMVNSEFERANVTRDFSLSPEKIVVCANGADSSFRDASPEPFKERYGLSNFVLMTGLVEERKNQISLIRAMRGLDIPLVLIGGAPAIHQWYHDKCQEAAGPNVHFLDFLDHDDPLFRSAYAACKVLALPSWHETTGKSALEAGLLAKNVIMTSFAPAAKEYFQDLVCYVDPRDVPEMRKAVLEAVNAPPATALQDRVAKLFTWETVLACREQHYFAML